jgi:lipopolysaccharide transport system permease protein
MHRAQEAVMIDAPLTLIGGSRRSNENWRELWDYRELLYFLVWRDVKVRYKQTVLGAGWAVVQPVATMVVFSVVFGRLASMPSDGVPYPLFALAALVPWTYFSTAISQGASSLVGSQHLVSKVYFPRLLVPLASVFTPLVDGLIAMVILIGLLLWYGGGATLTSILALPAFVALAVAAAFAATLWLAALNVQFRDVRYVMPFLVQFWLFVTPVAYPATLIAPMWRPLYALNPMATVVDGFRWSLLGAPAPPMAAVIVSCVMVAMLIVGGIRYFRQTQGVFADVI